MLKLFSVFSKNHKYLLYLSLGFLLSLTFLELLIFSLLQEILNYFNGTSVNNRLSNIFNFLDGTSFKFLLITFFIIFTFRSLVYVCLSYVRNKLVQSVNNDVSKKIFSNYLSRDFSFFINTNSSKLTSNIILEVEKFAYRTIDPLIYFLAEVFIILGIFLFLSFSYFQETLLMTLLIFVFYFIFYKTYIIKIQSLGERKTETDSKKIEDLQKSFYIINEIKIGKLENFFKKNFYSNTEKSSQSMFILTFFTDLPKAIIELVSLFFIFVLLYYSFFFLNYEKKEILSMSGIFVIALFRLLPSANRIYHSLNSIKYHYSSIDIIHSELFKNKINKKIDTKKINYGTGSIKLNNVSFGYEQEKNILSKVNLEINSGKPGNLMIKNILKSFSININKSFMIGDNQSDEIAAKKSNLKFFYSKNNFFTQIKEINMLINKIN